MSVVSLTKDDDVFYEGTFSSYMKRPTDTKIRIRARWPIEVSQREAFQNGEQITSEYRARFERRGNKLIVVRDPGGSRVHSTSAASGTIANCIEAYFDLNDPRVIGLPKGRAMTTRKAPVSIVNGKIQFEVNPKILKETPFRPRTKKPIVSQQLVESSLVTESQLDKVWKVSTHPKQSAVSVLFAGHKIVGKRFRVADWDGNTLYIMECQRGGYLVAKSGQGKRRTTARVQLRVDDKIPTEQFSKFVNIEGKYNDNGKAVYLIPFIETEQTVSITNTENEDSAAESCLEFLSLLWQVLPVPIRNGWLEVLRQYPGK